MDDFGLLNDDVSLILRNLPEATKNFTDAQISPKQCFIAGRVDQNSLLITSTEDEINSETFEYVELHSYNWVICKMGEDIHTLLVVHADKKILIYDFYDEEGLITSIKEVLLKSTEQDGSRVFQFSEEANTNQLVQFNINIYDLFEDYNSLDAHVPLEFEHVEMIGGNNNYLVFLVDHKSIILLSYHSRYLKIESALFLSKNDEIVDFTVSALRQDWLFLLTSDSICTIHLCNKSLKSICLGGLNVSYFDISSSLERLILVDQNQSVYSLDLDEYFEKRIESDVGYTLDYKRFSIHNVSSTIEEEDKGVEELEEETITSQWLSRVHFSNSTDMKSRRKWFEYISEKDLGLSKPWSYNQSAQRRSASSKTQSRFNAFSIKGPNAAISLSYSGKIENQDDKENNPILTSVGRCKFTFTSNSTIIVDFRNTEKLLFVYATQSFQHITTIKLSPDKILLDNFSVPSLYVLDKSKLKCYVFSQSNITDLTSSVTNNFIMFDKYDLADQIYQINGWERTDLKLHTLKLGLQYRHLDTIMSALENLDINQQKIGCDILIQYVKRKHITAIQDESFWVRLLTVGMNFASKNIRKAAELTKDKQEYHNVLIYSKYLSTLRKYSCKIKENIQLYNTGQTHTLLSPFNVKRAKSRIIKDGELMKGKGSIMFGGSLSVPDSDLEVGKMKSDGYATSTSDFESRSFDATHESNLSISGSLLRPEELESLEMGLDKSKEISSSFGPNQHIWERMSDIKVIADALISSNISLALSYLRWRQDLASREGVVKNLTFSSIKEIGYRLIYQTTSREQYSLAKRMLMNLGECVNSHIKDIAWSTSIKKIRTDLLPTLSSEFLSPYERETVQLASLIDEHYPSTSYIRERESHLQVESNDKAESPFYCGDLEDYDCIDDDIKSHLQELQSRDSNSDIITGKGYSFFRLRHLENILKHERNIGIPILLDSTIMRTDNELSIYNEILDNVSCLSYLIRHNHFSRMRDWLDNYLSTFLLESVLYQEDYKLAMNEQVLQTIHPITNLIEDQYPRMTKIAKEIVEEVLAKYGLYLLSNADGFHNKLCNIAKHNLFDAKKTLTLSHTILPYRKLSSFHRQFIENCAKKNLLFLLQEYFDHFDLTIGDLANELLNLDIVRSQMSLRMLVGQKSGHSIFEASLDNARLILNTNGFINLNSMVSKSALQKRPLMALGTLAYAPLPIKDTIQSKKDVAHYIDKNALLDALKKFPTLKDTLFVKKQSKSSIAPEKSLLQNHARFNVLSSVGDINLYYLLKISSPFDITTIMESTNQKKYIKLDDDLFEQYRYVDSIEPYDFLLNKQPFRAYKFLSGRDFYSHSKDNILSKIRQLVFSKFLDVPLVSTCVSFLELSGNNTIMTKVDVDAIRRIYHYYTTVGKSDDDLKELCGWFIDLYNPETEVHDALLTQKVYQLLEKATENFSSSFSHTEISDMNLTYLQSERGINITKWNIVVEFSKVHNLPMSSTPLVEFARRDDWVSFLFYAEVLGYPAERVYDLSEYFENYYLKEHTKLAVKGLFQSTALVQEKSTCEDANSVDIFKMVTEATSRVYPGEALLEYSLQHKKAILAVLAMCYPDVTILNCIISWISASMKVEATSETDRISIDLKKIVSNLAVSSKSTWKIPSLSSNSIPAIDSLSTLSKFIILISEREEYEYIIRAFEIFEPGHPLIWWLKFVQAFQHNRFEASNDYLAAFMSHITTINKYDAKFKIGDLTWIETITLELADMAIKMHMPSMYERLEFLNILSKNKFNIKYEGLYNDLILMKRMNIEWNIENFVPPTPEYILKELLNANQYEEAREYSLARSLSPHHVTLKEAEHLISVLVDKNVWDSYTERTSLWSLINSLFLQKKIRPDMAIQFFFQRAGKIAAILKEEEGVYLDILPQTDTDDPPRNGLTRDVATEQILLLSLARKWIDGTFNQEVNHWPKGYTHNNGLVAWKSEKDILELDEYILKITVIAQLDGNNTRNHRGKQKKNDEFDIRTVSDAKEVILKIAHLFSVSVDDIQSKDPYDIVHFLLLEGPQHLQLTKVFVKSHNLDSERIAYVLAERCFKSIIELDGNFSRMLMSRENSVPHSSEPMSLSRVNSSSSLSSMSVAESFVGMYGSVDPSVYNTNYEFAPTTIGYYSAPTTPVKSDKPSFTAPTKSRFWSSKHFPDYLELTGVPSLVGDELLSYWKKSVGLSSAVEVEIFIRALICYKVAQDIQKQKSVFKHIKERVPFYVKARQYKWLVRIITGTKQYGKLQYILDILVQHECFDMILSKNIPHLENDDDKNELKFVLYNFLKTHYPTHIQKMKLLFLRFNMHREHADLLQEKGWAHLNSMKARIEPSILLQAMDCFIEAADNYNCDKAYTLERKCLDMVALLQLQFEIPETRITNLKPDQAQLFIQHCSEFEYSLVVANAYNLNSIGDWVEPLYTQVIINNNFHWYDEFRANVFVDEADLYDRVVKRFKNDPQRLNYVGNLKAFLECLGNHFLRYKFAKELELYDISDNLVSLKGLDYYLFSTANKLPF